MKTRQILAAAAAAVIALGASLAQAAEQAQAQSQAQTQASEPAPYVVKHVTAETPVPFPVKDKVTVVDFGAPWCASCPEMERLMRQMQEEYGDRAAFVTINVDEWQGIEEIYLIEQMPSQIFYDKTGEPIWMHTGDVDADEMRSRVNTLLAGPKKD